MKLRNIITLAAVLLAATALATLTTFNEAVGSGKAVNGDGKIASFVFDAHSARRGDKSRLSGKFNFEERTGDHAGLTVRLPAIQSLTVNQNVATFSGPGVYRTIDGQTVHEYKGTVTVVATSNGHPDEDAAPDTMSVTFTPANADGQSFSFTGNLTKGDTTVSTTQSY